MITGHISQIRKLRSREVKSFARGHRAGEWLFPLEPRQAVS